MQPPGRAEKQTLALLGALCFFLSAIEYMIPKPLPFIRLGLANFPLLLALDIMPFSSFIFLIGIKVTGQALISGTLFSYVFLFSMGGTGVSGLFMYALRRGLGRERISLAGISAAGALASNGVTLVLARYLVFGESIIYAAAPVLALGIVTGTILGIGAEYFIRRSEWHAGIYRNSNFEENKPCNSQNLTGVGKYPGKARAPMRESFFGNHFSSGELAIAGLCMMPALLFNPDTYARIIQFLFFSVLALLSGKKNNFLITFAVMLGIIFFNLLVPYGEILFSIGPLRISSGALLGGIRRAVTLEGLFMLSRFCIRPDLCLPGSFGEITGEAFGIFADLTEEKNLIRMKNWAGQLDGILLSYTGMRAPGDLEEQPPGNTGCAGDTKNKPGKVSPPGLLGRPRIILVALTILAWLPLLLSLKV